MNKIICPKCKAVLNPDKNVVISAKNENNNWGLVLLSSKLGDYSVLTHIDLTSQKGDYLEFYCPACHYNLSSLAPEKNLAIFEMIDENKELSTIIISGIAGEKCTYKITEGNIESHGLDANKYKFNYQNMLDFV